MKLQLFDHKDAAHVWRKKERLQPKEHRPHSETQELGVLCCGCGERRICEDFEENIKL